MTYYANDWLKRRLEEALLRMLEEYGISLDAPETELRRAFVGTAQPKSWLRMAKALQVNRKQEGQQ